MLSLMSNGTDNNILNMTQFQKGWINRIESRLVKMNNAYHAVQSTASNPPLLYQQSMKKACLINRACVANNNIRTKFIAI